MTSASPGFSKVSVGSTTSPNPWKILADPGAISARRAELAGAGPWSASPAAHDAWELLNAIGAQSLENTAVTGPVVTRGQLATLLAASRDGAQSLATLQRDGLVATLPDGSAALAEPPANPATAPWPGWEGPDPATTQLRHMPVAWQREQVEDIHRRLLAEGLPPGLWLPPHHRQAFEAGLARGAAVLPQWAWAWCLNRRIPHDRHPVSRRTVANRLADLGEQGRLVCKRPACCRFDPGLWRFTVIPAAWAVPAPGLRGALQRAHAKARMRRIIREAGKPRAQDERAHGEGPSQAWRLQQARWAWRDREAAAP